MSIHTLSDDLHMNKFERAERVQRDFNDVADFFHSSL